MKRFLPLRASVFLGLLALLAAPAALAQDQDQPAENQPSQDQPAQDQPAEKDLLVQAYELTQGEVTIDNLTRAIELCEQGLETAADAEGKAYANRLLAWSLNRRGEAHAAADSPDEAQALADFEAAIKIDPNKWKPYHNRGVSYGLAGEFEKAEADFSRVIEMNRGFAKAYFNRGEVRTRLANKLQEAVRDYTQAIRLNPQDSASYNSRGFAWYTLEQRGQALSDYNQAIRLDDQNYEAYTNRGNLYADLGRLTEAIRDFQTAIGINAEFGPAYASAAWFRATCPSQQLQSGELALRSAKKAIELDGESARYLDVLAAAHARAEEWDDAVAAAKKALEMADADHAEEINKRLTQYEQQQPYVDVLERGSRR